jgi:hypothetical protein
VIIGKNMSYQKDKDSAEGLVFLIIAFFVLTPVAPAGDLGLILIRNYTDIEIGFWLSLLTWTVFSGMFAYILFIIYNLFFINVPIYLVAFLAYVQGVAFAFLLEDLGYKVFSALAIKFVTSIYNFFHTIIFIH